jgi:hypothetical protein
VQGSVHPRKKPSVKHVNCHAPNLWHNGQVNRY